MKFDEFDARMRRLEAAHDRRFPPDGFVIARLDGRSFTRLTRKVLGLGPFSEVFRDHMVAVAKHCMGMGYRVPLAYTESDEISLLVADAHQLYGGKARKLLSLLAGEASAVLSVRLGLTACFDCRALELSTVEEVVDYFRWRAEDAHRNAVNALCTQMLRGDGASPAAAQARLAMLSFDEKLELLLGRGIAFDAVDGWQRHGIALTWAALTIGGTDPRTGQAGFSRRRRVRVDLELTSGAAVGAIAARCIEEMVGCARARR